jgi:hypothetical protein
LGDQLDRRPGAAFGRDAVALREAMFDPEETSCAARAGWQRSSSDDGCERPLPAQDEALRAVTGERGWVRSWSTRRPPPVPQSDLKGPSYLP